MFDPSPTRRRLLQAGAGAVGATALAGCTGLLGSGGGSVPRADPLSAVPTGSTVVFHANVDALLADDVLREQLNELLDEAGAMGATGPASVEAGLDQAESALGLDLRNVSALVAFGGYASGAPAGAVVWTDWSTSELEDALAQSGADLESEEYAGQTILRSRRDAVADLGDGTFAFTDADTVETVVDVATGDGDAVGGRVREGFEAARNGAMRLAFEAPPGAGQGAAGSGAAVDPAAFQSVTHGYGSYVIQGGNRTGSLTLEAESSDGAADAADALRQGLAVAEQELQRTPDQDPFVDEMRDVVDAVEIQQAGTAVTVRVDEGEFVPLVLAAVVGSFVLGLGASQQAVAPQATFDFSYDTGAGTVTVTHTGGDHIPADELSFRGLGLESGSRPWNGDTSAEIGGRPAVTAGDSDTVAVTGDDYELMVVWESTSGDTSSELASDRGPAA